MGLSKVHFMGLIVTAGCWCGSRRTQKGPFFAFVGNRLTAPRNRDQRIN
jgi:hypothetical protein